MIIYIWNIKEREKGFIYWTWHCCELLCFVLWVNGEKVKRIWNLGGPLLQLNLQWWKIKYATIEGLNCNYNIYSLFPIWFTSIFFFPFFLIYIHTHTHKLWCVTDFWLWPLWSNQNVFLPLLSFVVDWWGSFHLCNECYLRRRVEIEGKKFIF